MAIDEKQFKQLRQRADAARKARDRAEGQLESAMERLQDEFGCDTIEKAEKLARTLKKEAATAEAKYDEAVAAFEESWEAQLED